MKNIPIPDLFAAKPNAAENTVRILPELNPALPDYFLADPVLIHSTLNTGSVYLIADGDLSDSDCRSDWAAVSEYTTTDISKHAVKDLFELFNRACVFVGRSRFIVENTRTYMRAQVIHADFGLPW